MRWYQAFQESLIKVLNDPDNDSDNFFGLSLREIVHTFKWQTLVLFKCLLLQPKVRIKVVSQQEVCKDAEP